MYELKSDLKKSRDIVYIKWQSIDTKCPFQGEKL